MVRSSTSNNRIVVALLVIGALCVAAVVAGWVANRDDTDEGQRWADSVCTSLQEWRDEIGDAAESVDEAEPAEGQPGGFTTLDDAYFDVRDSTTELAEDLRAIGAPDTDGGRAARDRLRQLSERLDSLVDQLLGAASSTEVITDAEGLRGLGDQVIGVVGELEQLESAGELRVALREQQSCRGLRSSGA